MVQSIIDINLERDISSKEGLEMHNISRSIEKNKACNKNLPYIFPNQFCRHLKTRAPSSIQAYDGRIAKKLR